MTLNDILTRVFHSGKKKVEPDKVTPPFTFNPDVDLAITPKQTSIPERFQIRTTHNLPELLRALHPQHVVAGVALINVGYHFDSYKVVIDTRFPDTRTFG